MKGKRSRHGEPRGKQARHRMRRLGHRILSVGGVVGLSAFALGLLGASAFYTQQYMQSGQMAAVVSGVLVNLVNNDRAAADIGTLAVSPVLTEAAQAKADDEASKGYFAHISPDGKNSWYWFKQAGYSFTSAGENLAVDFTDSDAVEQAWMNSPTHRANILNAHFTQVGIATATGTFEGHQTVFVVQMFGTPATGATGAVVPVNAAASAKDLAVAKANVLGAAASAPAQGPPVQSTQPVQPTHPVQNVSPVSPISHAEASPQTALRDIYLALGVLVLIALLSVTGFEFKRHHVRHALAGLFLIVLLGGLYAIASQFVFTTPVLAVAMTSTP